MLGNLQQDSAGRIASWEVDTPHDFLQLGSVQDAFEVLAPSVSGPLVAQLVPLPADGAHLSIVDLYRDAGCVTLGRSKQLPVECRVDGSLVSGHHCELRVSIVTQQVTIRDVSTNGTYVNGKRLQKGLDVRLEDGDAVFLTRPACSTESTTVGGGYVFKCVCDTATTNVLKEELTCPLCGCLFFRPCSALPCMHVFCASCISRRINAGNTTCIQCTAEVLEICPTHKMQSLVDEFLRANPHMKRSSEDKTGCQAYDRIPLIGKVLQKRNRSEESVDCNICLSDKDMDENGFDTGTGVKFSKIFVRDAYGHTIPKGPCRQCENSSSVDAFRCPAGAPHLCCLLCHRLFPDRPLCSRPQSCQLCNASHCNLYYEHEGGCPSGESGAFNLLRKLNVFSSLPKSTFCGNVVEQNIFSRYLAANGIELIDVWKECLAKLQSMEWVPDISCVNGQLLPDSPLCKRCANDIFAALLFHYRRAVPRSDLSESANSRPDCWYGIDCCMQFLDAKHAKKYNHVCYQEKRKE